jgi:hypothetical protein
MPRDEFDPLVRRYLSLFFLITYLVLPSVTTTIAGIIPMVNVDPDHLYPSHDFRYMRHDLNVSATSSRYQEGIILAAVMTFVYPIGIPLLYLFVLYINSDEIESLPGKAKARGNFAVKSTEDNQDVQSKRSFIRWLKKFVRPDTIFFLHGAYEPQYWYWEVVETGRRLLLTAAVSIVSTGE